jgi:hypothetical protein
VILIKSAGELLEHWSGMRGFFFSARVKSITAEATHFLAPVSLVVKRALLCKMETGDEV